MLQQNQLSHGASPRNTTLRILNANNFFNLDYQNQQQRAHPINNNFISRFMPNTKIQTYTDNGFMLTNMGVKSAQYSRKNDNMLTLQKVGFNMGQSGRQKDQRKRRSSIEYRRKMKITDFVTNLHNTVEYKSERQDISNEKQKLCKSVPINPQALDELRFLKDSRNNERRTNSFSENYKNKRKLLDRMTHRKLNDLTLKWDTKPKDIIKNEFRSKYWSPYAGNLINRRRDSLLESIQGNKIQFSLQQYKNNKGIGKIEVVETQ